MLQAVADGKRRKVKLRGAVVDGVVGNAFIDNSFVLPNG